MVAAKWKRNDTVIRYNNICKPLVAYCNSAQVLKSTENTRILLLPGPSDAETLTIINTGLEKHKKRVKQCSCNHKGFET